MRFLKTLFLLVVLGTFSQPLIAQQTTTSLVIALPNWWEGQFDEAIFDDFEAQHIGVEVVPNFVTLDDTHLIRPDNDFDTHIDTALEFAGMGDVLFSGTYLMSAEATRAGAYLDLMPLTLTDADLNTDDFYPAMWQSFQWDGGLWAVPVAGSLTMTVYEQTIFDQANYPYPTSSWTLADYANASRDLATYDNNGNVTVPGLHTHSSRPLFYSLLNHGVYNSSATPETVNLMQDDVVNLVREWTQLREENVANPLTINFDIADVPLNIEQTFRLSNRYYQENGDWHASLLPNGRAGLSVDGFAVSSGATHPELAYELAMYLSAYPDITRYYSFDVPARRSMEAVANRDQQQILGEQTAEQVELLYQGLANAVPYGEMRYYGYIDHAIQLVNGQGLSVDDALIQAQQLANENLRKAQEIASSRQVFVEMPASTPALADGEIELNFALNTVVSPTPNQDQWEQVARDFVANDAQVGNIRLHYGFNGIQQVATEHDCFYRQLNDMQPEFLQYVLPIEPFLNADPTFNRDDMIPGTLSQATYSDQIWGLPMNVTPSILWVNEAMFAEAGIPLPNNTWTVNEFANALAQLDQVNDNLPFVPNSFGGNYIISLITGYGGRLYDPQNADAVPDLMSEPNINAIRQVLDLARNGLIDYQELGGFSSQSGFDPDNTAIYDATLSALDFRFQGRGNTATDNYQAVLFPRGTQYTPMTLDVGIAYISAGTPYADACYRWLSYLAQTPDLFESMPARTSQIESAQSQGEDIYAVYQSISTILQEQNTVVYPLSSTDPTTHFYQTWMFRAFDAYVLEDVPLETALADAQQTINDYRSCIDPIDRSTYDNLPELNRAYQDCATQVDPIFAEQFNTN